jgi:hypothetical protein
MRLSAESHARVEQFFREHLNEPGLSLPPINVHGGTSARLLMAVARMGAITFGRNVFVRPALFGKGAEGRATLPAWLVVHEAAHVLQYGKKGYPRFFRDYLRGYWRALRAGGRWDKVGRMVAYMSIAEEREAQAAETAYILSRGEADKVTLT